MAKIAILGDIHANIDALDVVLDDCAAQGVTEFLCTGDVVGYGAAPRECIQRIRELRCPVTMGNHDFYICTESLNLDAFNPHAALGVKWTREQLSEEDLQWLRKLPFTQTIKGITLVHATMDRPQNFGYVFDNLQAAASFTNQKTPVCFHGHTHCPMIYEHSLVGDYRIDPQTFKCQMGRKYFVNVGSVGQPRDGDPRAAYVIYDNVSKIIEFRRLNYDISSAQARIREAGLPERLAERLAFGQ